MINFIKLSFLCCSTFLVFPIICLFYLLSLFSNTDALTASFSQFFSMAPGKLGVYFRAGFFKLILPNFAYDAHIGFGVLLSHRDTLIAKGVYIGPQSNIGKCEIQENCLLGSGVHIMSGKGQHNFDDLNTPIKDQGGTFEKITIGHDSWIGNGALIMASIGEQCVVAAGSVVINEVPDFAIVAGNPAKVIKLRNE